MNYDPTETPAPTADGSDQAHRLPRAPDPAPAKFRADYPNDQFVGSSGLLFEQAMAQTRMAVCLCDPHQPGLPIIFANRAFRDLTGFPEDEIMGRSCKFLQGPDTDPAQIAKIRQALETETVTVVELLNYRYDGSTFWNALHLGPIYNDAGELLYFFGSQWDVSDVRVARAEEAYARDMARELSHRMKNMFSVISGIVNITGRMRGIESEAREINERVQALGRAYETTLDEASSGDIAIGPAIHAILQPYDANNGNLELLGNGLKVPFSVVSVVGLALHELAANATKYGAWLDGAGRVSVDWTELVEDGQRNLRISWIEQGGPQVSEPPTGSGSGNAIIDRMVRAGGGVTLREWKREGLQLTLTFPLQRVA